MLAINFHLFKNILLKSFNFFLLSYIFSCFRHLIKLFDSIASLEFIDSKITEKKVATGMHAKDSEYVKFNEDCDCSGPVSIL